MQNTSLLEPLDSYNQQLLSQVRPPRWCNPTPAGPYNVVVVGGGTAGLVVAAGAAGLGAKVALVEKHLLGGDCLNVGCVPSKSLLAAAQAVAAVKQASRFGLQATLQGVDFSQAMAWVRQVRATLSAHDAAQRFAQEYGVDVFFGQGRFLSATQLEVEGQVLEFTRAVITTGARAAVPPIPGLREAGFFTNETIFNLTALPQRLAVLGGGPIGCELAQAFARLGSQVTVVEMGPQLLPKEDIDAAALLQQALQADGVQVWLGTKLTKVSVHRQAKLLQLERNGQREELEVDAILVAVGRTPNLEGLDLEKAGVVATPSGVKVDRYLRTSNPAIFAAGDICSPFKFTHAADAMARVVVQNALFPFAKKKASALLVPWCTYTDPEVAHVGLGEKQAQEEGVRYDVYRLPLAALDRAAAEGNSQGFFKVLVEKGRGKILGATVVARHAGDLVSLVTVAMTKGLPLQELGGIIYPYPTYAEGFRKLADAFNRKRLSPRLAKVLRAYFLWLRR